MINREGDWIAHGWSVPEAAEQAGVSPRPP